MNMRKPFPDEWSLCLLEVASCFSPGGKFMRTEPTILQIEVGIVSKNMMKRRPRRKDRLV